MSTRTVRRDTRNRSSRHTQRRKEITSNEIIEQLKKFEKEKNKFADEFNLQTLYEEIRDGKEMLNAFKQSNLYVSIDKFVNEYIKQENKKLNKVDQKLRKDIKTKLLNIPNKSEKRELLNKKIEEYEEIIGKIRTAMEPKKSDTIYTFEYYYNKGYENISSSNNLKKVKNDIADLQLLFDDEEDITKKEQLGQQLDDKYKLLNKTFVDFAFVDLLARGFETPVSVKEDMYYSLMDYIQKLLQRLNPRLNPSGENMRASGKKKTKKRQYRRKIIKSKHRKKLI